MNISKACQSRWHAYECDQSAGHSGPHATRDGFTRWPDSADTRQTISQVGSCRTKRSPIGAVSAVVADLFGTSVEVIDYTNATDEDRDGFFERKYDDESRNRNRDICKDCGMSLSSPAPDGCDHGQAPDMDAAFGQKESV